MKVCILCLGNICRSPMAEVVLRDVLPPDIEVDSAGLATGHAGQPMDPRARRALAARGYDGTAHRARQFDPSWERDLFLVMDQGNLATLEEMGIPGLLYAGGDTEIPDPYWGSDEDFARVLDMIIAASPPF